MIVHTTSTHTHTHTQALTKRALDQLETYSEDARHQFEYTLGEWDKHNRGEQVQGHAG